jgi:NAD(P)-dependent dehydrogenase (short-subunit alcohol dehydrogenase family)
MDEMEPRAQTALVTGARRGIGCAICVELARRGFNVVFTDVIDDEDTRETINLVREAGREALFVRSNLSEIEGHSTVVEQAVAFGGGIDCLVNNAGIGSPSRGDMLDVNVSGFDSVVGVNLRGTFFLTQAVARHMDSTSSRFARSIVTVSSVSAEMASPERAEYCLSKSALPMLTKLFALRLAKAGIGVFEVRPGIIRTPMTAGVSQKYEERFAQGLVPMYRWGEANDVAQAVAQLAGGAMNFATGSVLHVDGGLSIAAF